MNHDRCLRARIVLLASLSLSLPPAANAADPAGGGCALDWNRDGRVDVSDLCDGANYRGFYWEWYVLRHYPQLYPSVFPSGNAAKVDWNGDGRITDADLTGTSPLGFYYHWVAYTNPRTRASYVETYPGVGCASASGSVGNIVERDLVGQKRLLMIPISLSRSSHAAIATQSAAQQYGLSVSQMLSQQSHGKLDMRITATPVLDLPQTQSYYVKGSAIDIEHIRSDVIELARRRGYNVAAYDYAMVLTPKFWSNNLWGVAPAWKMVFVSLLNPAIGAHELGHAFGWAHAARWECSSGSNPLCSGGTLFSDGDHFDVMGLNNVIVGRFCPWKQKRARWLDDRHLLRVTSSGTYTINSLHVDPSTYRAGEYAALELRLDEFDSYWVYFRGDEPLADDGAIIARTTNQIRGQSVLYDMTPGSQGSWQDARLAAGRTFNDPAKGISVAVLAVRATSLDVRVTVPWSIGSIAEPPVIDVISPTRHDTVRGRWTFKATAYDPARGIRNGDGIRKVTLRLNGDTMVAWIDCWQPPYALVVDTNTWTIPDGEYRLFVEAEDLSGRKTQAVFPTFIDNSGPSF